MERRKITVVGAGNVGGTVAQRLAEQDRYHVTLVDVVGGLPQGKALDLAQAGPICGYDTPIVGDNGYESTGGSSLVVITSGIARKPGMNRDELLSTNTRIVAEVVRHVIARSPEAILLVVTNPLDAMAYVAYKVSGFPRSRVLGMAGVLDTARLRAFIAAELGASVRDVQTMVLGSHGDTMVPLPRYTTVAGRPITEWMSEERLEALLRRTRDGGAEIVKLLKAGSAFYAPSAAVVEMVDAVMQDRHRVLPCSAHCQGEYGVWDLFIGVPARLGEGGVEAIIEYELTDEERKALKNSVAAAQDLCMVVDKLLVGNP